jgi:hypothetical protein
VDGGEHCVRIGRERWAEEDWLRATLLVSGWGRKLVEPPNACGRSKVVRREEKGRAPVVLEGLPGCQAALSCFLKPDGSTWARILDVILNLLGGD